MNAITAGRAKAADWLTNCPEAAKALCRADRAYADALRAAQGFGLHDKIVAHRQAGQTRQRAYAAIARGDYGNAL